jgi:hypothetical protein
LYLLVPDLADAEDRLTAAGWATAAPFGHEYHFLNGPTSIAHRRLMPPNHPASPSQDAPGPTTTVLLPAACWGVPDIEDVSRACPESFIPPLPNLLNGLIQALLDLPPPDGLVRDHLATQVSYLYGHCETLKDPAFADRLLREHRQFHYDALSKPGLGTLHFIREQRHVRDEIRNGRREPRRNSWYLPPNRRG